MQPFVDIKGGGGANLSGGLGDRLLSVEVHDEAEDKSDRVTMEIDDRPGMADGAVAALPVIGMTVEVIMGYRDGKSASRGTYLIDELTVSSSGKKGRVLQVTGRAAAMAKDFRTPRTKSYHQMTVGEIAEDVAGRAGYSAVVDPELSGVVIRHIDQHRESDMAFLSRLAGMHDGVARPMQGRLVVAKRGTGKTVSGKSLPTITLTEDMCESWDFKYSAREEAGKAKGMDSSNYKDGKGNPPAPTLKPGDYIIEAEPGDIHGAASSSAPSGAVKKDVAASSESSSSGGSGGGVRATYTDIRTGETKVVTAGSAPYHDLRYSYHNEQEAIAAVTEKMNSASRAKASFSCTIPGNPDVQAEAVLILSSFRPYIPTRWRIKSCEHTVDKKGYVTKIDAELFEEKQEDAAGKIKKSKSAPDDTIDKNAPKEPVKPVIKSTDYIIEAD